ncbi:hypothetical protein U1Q18_038704 [Sarracenia purpurea var. burkii]
MVNQHLEVKVGAGGPAKKLLAPPTVRTSRNRKVKSGEVAGAAQEFGDFLVFVSSVGSALFFWLKIRRKITHKRRSEKISTEITGDGDWRRSATDWQKSVENQFGRRIRRNFRTVIGNWKEFSAEVSGNH